MIAIILLVGIAFLVACEMRLRSPGVRSVIVVSVCLVSAGVAFNIGRDWGDAIARNAVSATVNDALRLLERTETNGSGAPDERLLELMAEQLPEALLDDRKSMEFLNKIERDY